MYLVSKEASVLGHVGLSPQKIIALILETYKIVFFSLDHKDGEIWLETNRFHVAVRLFKNYSTSARWI